MWIAESIVCTQISVTKTKPISINCVALFLCQLNILLIVLYIPPLASLNSYRDISEFLISLTDDFLNLHPNCDIFCVVTSTNLILSRCVVN